MKVCEILVIIDYIAFLNIQEKGVTEHCHDEENEHEQYEDVDE